VHGTSFAFTTILTNVFQTVFESFHGRLQERLRFTNKSRRRWRVPG
jgi:hypothetical protein